MSVEKVKDYLTNESKGVFRRGYSEVLPLIHSANFEEQLRVLGSVNRVETLVGIGTNNRAENFQFPTRHLSVVEQFEQTAQKAFNDEYMKRVEELDKLRIDEVVFQLGETLQSTKPSKLSDMFASNPDNDFSLGDGFNFEEYQDDTTYEGSDKETSSSSKDDELGLLSAIEPTEDSEFTKFFSDLEG